MNPHLKLRPLIPRVEEKLAKYTIEEKIWSRTKWAKWLFGLGQNLSTIRNERSPLAATKEDLADGVISIS